MARQVKQQEFGIKKATFSTRDSVNAYTRKKARQQEPAPPSQEALASCHIKDKPAATLR